MLNRNKKQRSGRISGAEPWIAGSSPAMTIEGANRNSFSRRILRPSFANNNNEPTFASCIA
jgi:hypothetical protein